MSRCSVHLAVFLILGVTAATAAPAGIPDLIRDQRGALAWVSATTAVTAGGQLRADLLGDRISWSRNNAQKNHDGCQIFISSPVFEYFEPTATVDDLVRNSKFVLSGRILAIGEGFYYGTPGSLIRLETKNLKGSANKDVFLFYELAAIKTSEGMVCARPIVQFTAPSAGDRMLAFAGGDPARTNAGDIFWVDIARQLVHEHNTDKKLFAPASLRSEGQTYELLERRVALEVGRLERKRQ